MQPQRRQIQWMLRAGEELGIQTTAEGGGVMRQVAMILDGYTAVEHAPTDWVNMYDDFVQLYARSGTMYVPPSSSPHPAPIRASSTGTRPPTCTPTRSSRAS